MGAISVCAKTIAACSATTGLVVVVVFFGSAFATFVLSNYESSVVARSPYPVYSDTSFGGTPPYDKIAVDEIYRSMDRLADIRSSFIDSAAFADAPFSPNSAVSGLFGATGELPTPDTYSEQTFASVSFWTCAVIVGLV